MDIAPAAQPQTSTNASGTVAQEDDGTVITSDFEAFLRLLTTQLENQDPLNPLDSADFATQLATFSGVEQQVRTNTLLGDLQSTMALNGLGQLAGWIGMEARAQVPVQYTGSPVTLAADPPSTADRVELVVKDAGGQEVQRRPLPVSSETTTWTGQRDDGLPLPSGEYTLNVESYRGDELLETETASIFAEVQEAFQRGSETWLTLRGGQEIRASEIQGVRAGPEEAP
ncbi:MAG: flagellar hook capping FlgD N-terminal domain-containing protein [Pseudomonadota bacterium]